jgi:hypothetical protein
MSKPHCPRCLGLGVVMGPPVDIGRGYTTFDDVPCPDCSRGRSPAASREGLLPVDESISPAPPRTLDAGGFLLFAGEAYYPAGGWDDFRGRFGSLEAAQEWINSLTDVDWGHVVLGDKVIVQARYVRRQGFVWESA